MGPLNDLGESFTELTVVTERDQTMENGAQCCFSLECWLAVPAPPLLFFSFCSAFVSNYIFGSNQVQDI